MKNNKQKIDNRETLNGVMVSGVALDRNGLPILNNSMKFLTIGRTGSVRYRDVSSSEKEE